MITCPKCGKENQDHYKFCLGCGAELPRDNAPKPFVANTPPHGQSVEARPPAAGQAPMAAPFAAAQMSAPLAAPVAPVAPVAQPPRPAAAAAAPRPAAGFASGPPAAAGTVDCPQCGHTNPTGNRFCASCGYNLSALAAAAAPAASAPAPVPAPVQQSGLTLVALRADGSEAGRYSLPDVPSVTLGRDTGGIFAGDSYLSPRHATLSQRAGQLFIKDEGSLNGVYLKLRPNEPWPLNFNDVFRIGQEIVRFEALQPQAPTSDKVTRFGSPSAGYIGRLALVIGRDTTGNAFPIPERGVHCGRERGDILFSEDGYVSGLHCRVAPAEDGRVYLTDVGSSNGTFVRLQREQQVAVGDVLLMGQQLFRIDA
ncbi:MAG: FHA domain-containing protein [Polyangiaceae bacterium]|nr:FHA domain-containing protein [Polyangiaceae bacterium]